MSFNVVTNMRVMQDIKQSPYFKPNLGMVATIDKAGDRIYNERDKFAFFYNNRYRTTIYGQGNLGDIMFYVDHYIRDNQLAFYKEQEEFVFDHDPKMIEEKGINFFLGDILKRIDEKYKERVQKAEDKKIEIPKSNPNKIIQNPGAVSYEDLKAYLQSKNKL